MNDRTTNPSIRDAPNTEAFLAEAYLAQDDLTPSELLQPFELESGVLFFHSNNTPSPQEWVALRIHEYKDEAFITAFIDLVLESRMLSHASVEFTASILASAPDRPAYVDTVFRSLQELDDVSFWRTLNDQLCRGQEKVHRGASEAEFIADVRSHLLLKWGNTEPVQHAIERFTAIAVAKH